MTPFANRFTVVYDACVLFPSTLRDFLMWLALENIYRAKWSDEIHEEWIGAVLRKAETQGRIDITRDKLERTRLRMNESVLDCLVTGYESLIQTIELPDPKDRHVVAAAIKSQANAIVTFNLKHFPRGALAQFDIEPIHPDEFVLCQFDFAQQAVFKAAKSQRDNLKNPPKTVDEYLASLLNCGLAQTATILRQYRELL